MANVDDLKAKLIVDATALTDTYDKLECLAAIDRWYGAAVAVAALQATGIASYSIGGRSVTRRELPSLERTERQLMVQIGRWIPQVAHNSVNADLRGSMDQSILNSPG